MSERFLNDRVTMHCGDCLAVLPTLEENSIDSVCCDPPYHLTSIVKRFGSENAAPAKSNGATGVYKRASGGFMGKQWDGGDVAFRVETWREVFRVMKPGAHLIAFSGTRTYHRMACAIEDAGFEIRDQVGWAFGSGFPKSHNIGKSIDRAAGADRRIVGEVRRWGNSAGKGRAGQYANGYERTEIGAERFDPITAPATDDARQWEGWGTALKPAWEPIVIARKPLSESTIAENVLKWGCGALNIDACRVATDEVITATRNYLGGGLETGGMDKEGERIFTRYEQNQLGRWPANLITDGSEEVLAAFSESEDGVAIQRNGGGQKIGNTVYSGSGGDLVRPDVGYGGKGSAARFFYSSKADSDDRLGSKHPTVKPLDLMQYLCRLVTPPKGTCLDPFAGTGTTGEAAWREGFNAILIEREAEYQNDIRRRMKLALAGPDERARESIKEKMKGKPVDAGPLFEGWDDMWKRPLFAAE